MYFVGDTTIVFGPDTNFATNGHKTTHVEVLGVAVQAGKQYTIRLKRIGSGKLEKGTVTLNHYPLTDKKDFAASGTVLNLPVKLVGADTLVVEVDGGATDGLVVWILSNTDATVPVYSNTYTKTSGSKFDTTATFMPAITTGAPAYLYVNAMPVPGFHRATADIYLNGEQIVEDKSDGESEDGAPGFAVPVTLRAGSNTLRVIERGTNPARFSLEIRATTKAPPALTISSPAPNLITKNTTLPVSGTVTDATSVTVTVNGITAALGSGNSYGATVPLAAEGNNVITVHAVNAAGLSTDSTRTVKRDTQPPALLLSAPADQLLTNSDSVTVSGTVTDASALTLTVQGVPVVVVNGAFSTRVALNEGPNFILVTATDAATNAVTLTRQVNRDKTPPILAVTSPVNGATTSDATIAVAGTVSDASAVTVTVNGNPVAVVSGAFATTAALATGTNTITVVATDAATNVTTVTRSVTRSAGSGFTPTAMTETLRADASVGAPALSTLTSTPTALGWAFLYSGSNPIQTGVQAGAIDSVRLGALRGRVTDTSGQPLAGAVVTVHGHPELGQTISRANGVWDLAVNGGGDVVVEFNKSGFLPVQRRIGLRWQQVRPIDDVALTPLSTNVTAVDFTAPVTVARGSLVSDASGSRRATMLFQQSTQATLVMPNGSTQPAPATLHVRATEYTVGTTGPNAMPGNLPPTSAYTYAAELSADEVTAAGASSVLFSKPVAVYLENFLGIGVGSTVPVGVYSRQRASWSPEPAGRVVKILAITAGEVSLDVDGDGTAESPAVLDSLGIPQAERQMLAQLYPAGQSLWRVSVMHFSVYDFNYNPDYNPAGNNPPPMPQPQGGGGGGNGAGSDDNHPTSCPGSTIICESQVLGEQIGVQGTPFSLVYRTDRVPSAGPRQRRLQFRVSGDTVPASLLGIEVTLRIAGRVFQQNIAAAPNQSILFVWDGRDAFDRIVQGESEAEVEVGYLYKRFYQLPPNNPFNFAAFCEAPLGTLRCMAEGTPLRRSDLYPLTKTTKFAVGGFHNVPTQLGDWGLNAHHFYDVGGGVLYLGDGSRIDTKAITSYAQSRVVGTGAFGTAGDGGNAHDATFKQIGGIAVGADGSVYIADAQAHVVRIVSPSGAISLFAGTGTAGNGAPGGQANATALNSPTGVGVGADGTVYIADRANDRVLQVGADSIARLFAGSGGTDSGDNGPAIAAAVLAPARVMPAPDGSVYILETGRNAVRAVSPSGIIRLVTGNPPQFVPGCADGEVSALVACYSNLKDLSVGPNGSLVLVDQKQIIRVDADGGVHIVGGTPNAGCGNDPASDGLPATQVSICPSSALALADGSVLFSDFGSQLIRKITADGRITRERACATNPPPFLNRLNPLPLASVTLAAASCKTLAIGPDGSIYVAGDQFVERGGRVLPAFRNAAFTITSSDGAELYGFDKVGRHLETRDALTGSLLLSFIYDNGGSLVGITDADGNLTSIPRNVLSGVLNGMPTAIVSPYGEVTTLALDGSGRLSTVTNPNGERVQLTYDVSGLLQSLTDPRGIAATFTYDSLSRLVRDDHAGGGFTTLTRQLTVVSDSVTLQDALGRQKKLGISVTPADGRARSATSPAGNTATRDERPSGEMTSVSPDGTVTTIKTTEDPRFGGQSMLTSQATVRLPDNSSATVSFGRVVKLANRADPSTLVTQTDTLVVAGQTFRGVYTAATRTFVTTSPQGRTSTMQLDSTGRVTQVTTAGLAPISYAYDSRGRLSSVTQGDRSEIYAYNAQGRLATVTDPLNRVTSFTYDAAGRVTSESLPGGRTVGFAYDSSSNLTSLTPPGKPAHAFSYNGANLPTTYQAPAVSGSTGTTKYGYSVERELLTLTRPDSQIVSVGYDAAGRPTVVTTAEGTHGITYNATTGQLSALSAPHGVGQTLAYNGALPTGTTWTGPVAGNVQFAYNNAFRLQDIQVNGTSISGVTYDRDGLPISNGSLSMSNRADNGLLEFLGGANHTSSWSYDSLAQVRTYAVTFDNTGDTLYRASYSYDKLGRITQLADRLQADTATYAYGYDAAGRLATVQKSGATIAAYTYDLNGNRVQATYPSGNVVGAVDNQDRLLSYGTNTYAYTGNGELQLKVAGTDSTKYRYDAFGNLRDVYLPNGDHVEYVIDAQQRRIGRKLNGTLQKGWLYQSQLAIAAEVDASGAVTKTFEYATHGNVPDWMQANGVVYRIITDHLGSVRLVVDVNGTVAQRIDYDAYGRVLTNTNPGFQPFGYAGGLLDDATGLTRFGARDYDAEIGRWAERDPLDFSAGSPNLYLYAGNDPENSIDPTGLQPLWETLGNLWNGAYTDPANEAQIQTLRAELRTPARAFVNRSALIGHPIRITEGFRSFERQDCLFSQSRLGHFVTGARAGQSYHNYGMAFDWYPLSRGRPDFGATIEQRAPMVAASQGLGFEWGGLWSPSRRDPPHFQMTLGYSIRQLQAQHAGRP